jgi:hypothetical protein
LGVVIYLFVRSSSYSPLSHQKTVAVSVRRILAGEKILDHSFLSRSWFSSFIQFVKDFPLWGKYGLEMFVLSPLVILVFFYFSSF